MKPTRPVRHDLTGKRYGKLLVIRRTENVYSSAKVQWLCRCDCGNEKAIGAYCLEHGLTKTCGCGKGKRLPDGESAFNSVVKGYKDNARKRGLVFELTDDDFRYLTNSPCAYCGTLPSNKAAHPSSHTTGFYVYNGIDRVDNNKGYTPDNCVPCCGYCNWIKQGKSLDEFLGHVDRIAEYIHGVDLHDIL